MRSALLLLVLAPIGAASESLQVDWIKDWDGALRLANREGRPIMVCVNGLDGEAANDATAGTIYRDPWFVALSRRFVMVAVSARQHVDAGPCPRFGRITCAQHLGCWEALRSGHGDAFLRPGTSTEMVSPQHAWFRPDGTLLLRREYFLRKAALMRRMRSVLAAAPADAKEDAPLDDRERALLDRLEASESPAARHTTLGDLLANDKDGVYARLAAVLDEDAKPDLACTLLRGLGQIGVAAARSRAERHLASREASVRSAAAVCLERLGHADSVAPLTRRVRREREAAVRRNLGRALGACAGPVGDKAAAGVLFTLAERDKDAAVRKHAVLALTSYAESHAGLVRKRLERLASRCRDADVRRAAVYVLAFAGDARTSLPVLEKMRRDVHQRWDRVLVENAIAMLRGNRSDLDHVAARLFREDQDDPARN